MTAQEIHETQELPVIPGAFKEVNGEPHLMGTKCSKCGAAFFPPRKICTYCLTDEGVEEAPLGNKGRLYAFTTIRIASKEFNPPYSFGYVILEPDDIRIPTLLTGVEDAEKELHTGMEMEMTIEPLRVDEKGNTLMTFKFKPSS